MNVALLKRIEPRQVPLLAGGAALLVLAALVAYLVLPQYREWRAAVAERDLLQEANAAAAAVVAERRRLTEEVAALNAALLDDVKAVPPEALETLIIGRLQALSWRRGVELVEVKPLPPATVGEIRETALQLDIAGDYSSLRAWLAELDGELDFVSVRQLRLAPLDGNADDPRLHGALVVAAYRTES